MHLRIEGAVGVEFSIKHRLDLYSFCPAGNVANYAHVSNLAIHKFALHCKLMYRANVGFPKILLTVDLTTVEGYRASNITNYIFKSCALSLRAGVLEVIGTQGYSSTNWRGIHGPH